MFDASATQRNLNAHGAKLTVDGKLGPLTIAALLRRASQRAGIVAGVAESLATRLPGSDISTPLRLRHFLAQCACETAGFTRLIESDGGDPHYFDRYEGRKVLGNTCPGDGAKFRGRGLLDTTGHWNYAHLAQLTGIDCIAHPELLAEPDFAVQAAIEFWDFEGCNVAADLDEIEQVTRMINGGLNGLADRKIYFERLGVLQP